VGFVALVATLAIGNLVSPGPLRELTVNILASSYEGIALTEPWITRPTEAERELYFAAIQNSHFCSYPHASGIFFVELIL